jgi:hypothetical protein
MPSRQARLYTMTAFFTEQVGMVVDLVVLVATDAELYSA